MRDNNTLPESYKQFFIDHDIRYLDTHDEVQSLQSKNILFVTSCSKTKTGNQYGIPKNFYVSNRNLYFYSICEKYNLTYAIQSDMYGLHFYDESLEYYDIHPSKLTQDDKKKLGQIISDKAQQRGIDCIIFWNSSPCMSRPYLEMLKYSNMEFYYISNLKLL